MKEFRMKLLLILLILLPILLSIADAAKPAKKSTKETKKTPIKYRRTGKATTYRELAALMDAENNDNDELDDEEDDDDDDDDDYDDDDVQSNDSANVRFPAFHELFPNPDGRPAGPNSYDAYLKHMPKAQQQQQGPSHGNPPPNGVRRAEPEPVYHNDDAPPRRKNKSPKRPPPQYREGPPPNYREGPPPNYRDGPPPNYRDGPPPSYRYQDGPPPPNYEYEGPSGPQGQYPQVVELPQGGEATPIFDTIYNSMHRQQGHRGRSEIPILEDEEEEQPQRSRDLVVAESAEVPDKPASVETVSNGPSQTMFNRPGFGSNIRPGFGTNRYYQPMTQETRYFRPVTNRIYTDYAYAPQGAFVMNGYRPSYRPRYEASHETPYVNRRSGQVYPVSVPIWGGGVQSTRYSRFYPFARYQSDYNPEYIVNPQEMLSRRKFRYHPSQRVPSSHIPINRGYSVGSWGGNPRDIYRNSYTGSQYHSSYIGSKF